MAQGQEGCRRFWEAGST